MSSRYKWLSEVGPLPKTIAEGIQLLGTVETPGVGNNKVIMGWAKDLGLTSVYSADSIPWCGLYVAKIVKDAGKDPVKDPLWARNWTKFGKATSTPGLGDVLVFVRNGGGHVGFYVAEDATAYHVLGGNQSDAVTITRIAKNRLLEARSPSYINRPASAKPYKVAAEGGLSTNES